MSNLQGPNAFADDGRTVIERVTEVRSHPLAYDEHELENIYELNRVVTTILDFGYEKIALQFPDELLADSTQVATTLKKRTGRDIYILADTSYGSCCVDEIAAQHVNADFIVHYGRSCLSRTTRLPVLYVFGKKTVDIGHCHEAFNQLFGANKEQPILVMYDVMHAHCIEDFVQKVQKSNYTHIIRSFVRTEANLKPLEETDEETFTSGRRYALPDGINIEDCSVFYIGDESLTLTNLIMTLNKCKFYTYNPKTRAGRQETFQVNKALMKRFYLIQKAKDANVIGIVVGTLGIASYMTILSRLKNLIRKTGRKSYTFAMGKLNIAKMANFMEIDCYVLVTCPENSLIDSKEFYHPIVTPFELEIALDRSKEWTGEYITDFQQLLSVPHSETNDELQEELLDDDEPHYSLVTGELRQGRRYDTQNHECAYSAKNIAFWYTTLLMNKITVSSESTTMVLRNEDTSVSTVLTSAAGEFFASRTFRGLEQRIGQTEVSYAEEGRLGTARRYDGEDKMM
ncbi:10714_t:CDS:10 [Paraglomus occultum]|uniref:2-(3-amino-3-carboxypropyl)histidine synthase subunit 2 n=1 Tax=Paraglomus occultum TaxID=144539 RepID=A0A9N9CKC8_9GLOM|nr:10714_t:CDS:10 [Paraglomus occultum]